ncbi:MAG: RDD family protein [Mucilaginibacter sp.]
MNNQYYILENEIQSGPFTFDELVEKDIDIHTKVLTPTNEWQYASELPEFYEYFESKGVYFPTQDNLATAGWRILAFFIDYILLVILIEVAAVESGMLVLPTVTSGRFVMPPSNTVMMIQAVFYVTYLIYNTLFELTGWQGSIGKKICGLRVVDANGQKIGFIRSAGRNLGSILSLVLLVPYLSMLFSEYKQQWYDNLANAYIIKTN